MGRPRKDPEKITPAKEYKIAEPEHNMIGFDSLRSCVGEPKSISKYVDSLDSLCNEFGFCETEFVRMFRAFRLCRKVEDRDKNMVSKHVDWISLDELNEKYKLGLPPAKGAARNYQRPSKRQYH